MGGKGKVKRNSLVSGKVRPGDSGMKYYDDLRKAANLRRGSVDNHGKSRGWRQNTFNNYVYDLQTDLRKMDFFEVGEADGIFGKKTKEAVENFQLSALTSERGIGNTTKTISNITMKSKMDGIVGEKTKAEIKIWLKNKYTNPIEINYPVPLIAQKYTHSCWAASFQMILAYNGIKWTQEEVCDNARLPRSYLTTGDSTADAITEASNLGFSLIGHPRATLQVEEWVKLLKEKGPLVVTWSGPHAVVLKGITKDPSNPTIFVNDPEPVNVGTKDVISMLDFDDQLSSETDWYLYYFKAPVSRQVTPADVEEI